MSTDPQKLQSVNFSKVNLFSKKVDVGNQDREFQIRIYVLNQGASNQNSVPKKCSKSG